MGFRRAKRPPQEASAILQGELPEQAPSVELPGGTAAKAPPFWKLGILVTASAFCGGIAVVLWNRRLLATIRNSDNISAAEDAHRWDDEP